MKQLGNEQETVSRIIHEAAEIADGINWLKARSMIYQRDAKETLARKQGLPLDTYYHLSCDKWMEIVRNAK